MNSLDPDRARQRHPVSAESKLFLPLHDLFQCHERFNQASGYKTFFMLNSTEHEINHAYKW